MQSQKKHQWWIAVLPALLTMMFCAQSAMAQATTTSANFILPIEATVATPPGDAVQLAGNLHVRFQVTRDEDGGLHISAHANGQGISGVADDGTRYQGTGTGNFNANVRPLDEGATEFTETLNVGLIGQGQAPNYRLHITLHGTINANGDLTAAVEEVAIHDN